MKDGQGSGKGGRTRDGEKWVDYVCFKVESAELDGLGVAEGKKAFKDNSRFAF